MRISDKLDDVYDACYEPDSPTLRKRAVAARQTVSHIRALLPDAPYGAVLDIGAGEGSVLSELSHIGFAREFHAVEVSWSGIDAIEHREIPGLKSVRRFDGYAIDASTGAYDVGTAIHVLEHVEHERAFIAEICRVCELVYIEVPLELTVRVERAIKLGRPHGHINFYSQATFRNLLGTSGVEIVATRLFCNSLDYERHVAGSRLGTISHAVRSTALKIAPAIATFAMTYLAGAVCRRQK